MHHENEPDLSWMQYFTEYYGNKHSLLPKFIFYSGHAEVIGPLTLAFGTNIVTNREPGSAIFLEYFTETSKNTGKTKLWVKVFYKPTASLDDKDTHVFDIPDVIN